MMKWFNVLVIVLCASLHPSEAESVRLAGGGSEHEGRVEVYYSGSWGTVCDHDWDIKDADVVCRMLEYSSAAAAVHRSYFGEGSGFVLLDNVNCSGSESSLSSCSHNGWGTHNCNHGDGAGVICTYAVPSTTSIWLSTPLTSRSLNVSWGACSGASRYYVDYRINSSSHWTSVELGNVISTQITNLLPSTTYDVRVQCANSVRRGLYSSTGSFTTARDQAPSTPTISVSTTSVSATVSWSCSGAAKYFINYYTRNGGSPTVVVVESSPATIRHLMSKSNYTFQIVCESEYGIRSDNQYEVSTDSLQPTILNVTTNSTSAVITWEPAARTGVEISHEVLVSGGSQPYIYTAAYGLNLKGLNFTVDNLTAETVYSFQVRAVSSSEGESSWSKPLTGITLPLFLSEVINITLIKTTMTTISVFWIKSSFRVDWYMLTIQSAASRILSATNSEIAVVNSSESYTFHDLLPLTDYNITIWAVNRAGKSPQSALKATTDALKMQANVLAISTSVLATLLALLIMCFISIFVLVRCRYHGKRKDSSASTAVSVSTKDEDGIEMEQNIAYGVVETRIGRPNHVDYYEETISFSNECINCNPLPSRIRADAISTLPVKSGQVLEPVYADNESFQKYSGWFMPSVNEVICDKMGLNDEDFVKLGPGIFYMFHKTKMTAKYIGFAANLPVALCGTIHNLYEKEASAMTPFEVELKYFSPKAEDWIVQVWQCEKESLLLERAKRIIENQTLNPHGLNTTLKIVGKEGWEGFAKWYTQVGATKERPQK